MISRLAQPAILTFLALASSLVACSGTDHNRLAGAEPDQTITDTVVVSGGDAEVQRLRAHFDSVDLELRQAELSHLTPGQRAWRSRLIEWLREYRDRGVFPQNDRFPDRAMPFFRDSRGVLCAVAYLVARSGRKDIVDVIARTRNNAYIAELADDPELVQWLDAVGLSREEAARIQPEYTPRESPIKTDYAIASAISSGSALITSAFNVLAPRPTTGWLGLVTGTLAGLTGVINMEAATPTKTLATANIAVGVGTVLLSVRGFNAASRKQPARPSEGANIKFTFVPPGFAVGKPHAVGFLVQARF